MRCYFSINQYDRDGDITQECVSIHLDDSFTVHFKNLDELNELILNLQNIRNEIKEL